MGNCKYEYFDKVADASSAQPSSRGLRRRRRCTNFSSGEHSGQFGDQRQARC